MVYHRNKVKLRELRHGAQGVPLNERPHLAWGVSILEKAPQHEIYFYSEIKFDALMSLHQKAMAQFHRGRDSITFLDYAKQARKYDRQIY